MDIFLAKFWHLTIIIKTDIKYTKDSWARRNPGSRTQEDLTRGFFHNGGCKLSQKNYVTFVYVNHLIIPLS